LEDYCKLQSDNYNVQRTGELLMDRPTDGLSALTRAWCSSPVIRSSGRGLRGWGRGGGRPWSTTLSEEDINWSEIVTIGNV